ncbi:MAG: helix-turn-helix domain-containing protein [Eubacterium sp.]|nr:helix-turn-helix domain-containing protein [Eubacterium sp.]MDE6156308.1 helix-turn-helix domain-containing protein [Eubacterium sp.]
METKEIIFELRKQNHLTQDELAEKTFVTRQAVSKWEAGEAIPNTETLKLLSKLFNISINTLLGTPQKLICQCCGMPLDDSSISKEPDGAFNEEYCKWCYTDGNFVYKDINTLIDFLAEHMANESFPKEQAKAYFEEQIPKLNYWSKNK